MQGVGEGGGTGEAEGEAEDVVDGKTKLGLGGMWLGDGVLEADGVRDRVDEGATAQPPT